MEETQSRLHIGFASAEHSPDQPVLTVKDVSAQFNGMAALSNISFQLQRGERVAVVGPNGAGKSTLFNLVAGVLSPAQGTIDVYGHNPDEHICIAYVLQRSRIDWQFPVTVGDVVMMGRAGQLGLFRRPRRKDRQIVNEALALVGMAHLSERQIGELSGGQQQRVFIARALAQSAELILMDEPLSGLDVKSQEDIFAILDRLRQRNVTVMVATHDLTLAAERFDRVMLLNQKIIAFEKVDAVFSPDLLGQTFSGSVRLLNTPAGAMFISHSQADNGEHTYG